MSANNYANASQLIDLLQAQQVPVLGAGGGFAPLGTLAFYDGTVAPQGWLACDGTVYNISDYPELATHYASHHGASNFYGGNGTTTFAVPDLRGEFLRGTGTNSHTNQGDGANVGVHQDGTSVAGSFSSGNNVYIAKKDSTILSNPDYFDTPSNYGHIGLAGQGSGSNDIAYYTSRPTNTSFLIVVKATVSGNPNAHQYSTEEQVVGRWIDGKPLYEKTIEFTTPSSSGVIPNTMISNLETCIGICFTSKNSDGYWIIANPTYYNQIFLVYGNNGIEINYNNNPSWIYNRTAYTTILYTKTS